MKIEYYPCWNLSIWINNSFDYTNFLNKITELYSVYLDNILSNVSNEDKNNIIEKSKKVIINDVNSINDLEVKDTSHELYTKYNSDILKSHKVGFVVEPFIRELYLYNQSINSDKNKLNETKFNDYLNHKLLNYKNMVWNSKQIHNRPQWYFYSNSTNEYILDNILYLTDKYIEINEVFGYYELENYICNEFKKKDISVQKYDNVLNDIYFELINQYKDINNKIDITYDIKYKQEAIVRFLHQNDYYFFEKLNFMYSLSCYKEEFKNIYEILKKSNKSNKNVYTIITPTVGNINLLKLKQVLKQEKTNYIHIILWDNFRKPMEYIENGQIQSINVKDLEDECTYCYEFMHPYFQYGNQRNDVWLRGVGATLTNTPYITYFDDDTWPERDHLSHTITYMHKHNLDYTYVIRRMWENPTKMIGPDNFEAIGEINKFGYRLIDNSSLYLKLDTARILVNMFLNNQIYGDDRLTYEYLTNHKRKGKRLDKILVNHIAKEHLIPFFKSNILGYV
jgi:hypothetical protein